MAAHPRSRGENRATARSLSAASGSSPLTRGKRSDTMSATASAGLIPAHAGKTPDVVRVHVFDGAHPRSRGENAINTKAVSDQSGSSPLTRGKRAPSIDVPSERGLIPAHAGKTGGPPATSYPTRAHPRSRGENPDRASAKVTTSGSSPLTRGKPRRDHRDPDPRRLIPAHAGKTTAERGCQSARRAHPRSRGENGHVGPMDRTHGGSSPLTRGKPLLQGRRCWWRRLIPAHAGKTSATHWRPLRSRAHPRSRGENTS